MSKCYKCGEQWTNENRVETPLLCPKCSLAPPGSDFSVDDAINGLKHMADDHKCCKPFIVATISKLEQLRESVNTAIWIRDKIQDKGGFGAGFEEWRDIEAASG